MVAQKNLRGSKKRKSNPKFSVSLLQDRIVKDMVAFLQKILSVYLLWKTQYRICLLLIYSKYWRK